MPLCGHRIAKWGKHPRNTPKAPQRGTQSLSEAYQRKGKTMTHTSEQDQKAMESVILYGTERASIALQVSERVKNTPQEVEEIIMSSPGGWKGREISYTFLMNIEVKEKSRVDTENLVSHYTPRKIAQEVDAFLIQSIQEHNFPSVKIDPGEWHLGLGERIITEDDTDMVISTWFWSKLQAEHFDIESRLESLGVKIHIVPGAKNFTAYVGNFKDAVKVTLTGSTGLTHTTIQEGIVEHDGEKINLLQENVEANITTVLSAIRVDPGSKKNPTIRRVEG